MNHGHTDGRIELENTVGRTVRVRRLGERSWSVSQRSFGENQDNAQPVTWLRFSNPGPEADVRVRLKWADFHYMSARRIGYFRQGRTYRVIEGRTTPTTTVYDFRVPPGASEFGAYPWYTNEQGERFINRMARRGELCRRRCIGLTAEGREITCLTIGESTRRRKPNIVVMARAHANESAGSFAVEATARFLLGPKAPQRLISRYVFHLLPVVNPDGVAHGLKLTRPGPADTYDMERGGMTSPDPTIRAIREELLRLRPAYLFDHHCYLFKAPMLYVFEKRLAERIMGALLGKGIDAENHASYWYVYRCMRPSPSVLRDTCYRRFGTKVVVTELPWLGGHLPADIGRLGVRIFEAALCGTDARRRT